MVHNNVVQAAIIDKLKAYEGLAGISEEIREADWQGKDFTYPNVRVDLLQGIPEGDGPCEDKKRPVTFGTSIRSKQKSSMECNSYGELVIAALRGKQLSSSTFYSGKIRLRQYPGSVHNPLIEVWSLTLIWEVNVYG